MAGKKLKTVLETLLKKDTRLLDEHKELNIGKVRELADKTDEQLIELLLSDEECRKKFFLKMKDVFVFRQNDFKFFLDANQIDNSYTAYENRIGLSNNSRLLKDNGDVVLNFPYKDCVLGGGQSREEGIDEHYDYNSESEEYELKNSQRKEIFFNEVIAQDEIDRLFEPKAFTNIKRYTQKGEEKLKNFNRNENERIADNLIIKGNNLLALHSLKEQFAGQVKLLYLDPPYNTENDSFQYNDSFTHSTWLTFMKNRLLIARELLSNDGAIFIQIDDKEVGYLRVLCDEVFGRENFKESIAVKNGSESGVNAINVMRGEQLFKVKEHILYYAKKASLHRFKPFYVKAISYNDSYRLEVIKAANKYTVNNVYKKILKDNFKQDTLRGLSDEQKQLFSVKFEDYCLNHSENLYALKLDIQKSGNAFKEFAKKNAAKGIVEEYQTSDGRITLVYKGGMLSSLSERIVKENGKKFYGTLISDFWWDIGATPSSEGSVELKSGKKPERLLKRIMMLCTRPGDIVMDFFLGSGSTCAVAMKMNRQFIGIEQLDYEKNDSLIRLKNVINGDATGISKDDDVNWRGGGSFIYMELKKWNEEAKEKITSCKSVNELQKLLEELSKKYFLHYNVRFKEFKEKIIHEPTFKKLPLKKQQEMFAKMLDLNQLYVNASEMEDKKYSLIKEDIALTKNFYNQK